MWFCPECWTQMAEQEDRCRACGSDLQAIDREDIERKLTRALYHPEPLTARRAAEILGMRRLPSAVPALVERLRTGPDPYLAADIATALGRIGSGEARTALVALCRHASVVVRHAAERALAEA